MKNAHVTKVVVEFAAKGFHEATRFAGEYLGGQDPMGMLDEPVKLDETGELYSCAGFAFGMQGESQWGTGKMTFYRIEMRDYWSCNDNQGAEA